MTRREKEEVMQEALAARQARPPYAGPSDSDGVLERGRVRLDRVRHRAYVDAKEVLLSPVMFRLLECLVERSGQTLSPAQLLELVPQVKDSSCELTIVSHMRHLRRRLRCPELIQTVRRGGYCYRSGEGCPPIDGLAGA
jgi:two-component system, OmpR family, response regulator RpaA